MKTEDQNVLNLELLEARLEMESAAAPLDGTTPICICHFN